MAAGGGPLDRDGVLRVLAELCAVLRRRGVPVAPPELADAARALTLLGLATRDEVREALATTLVKRQAHRALFDEVFAGFFAPGVATPLELFDRLRAEGFTDDELAALQEALAAAGEGSALAALLGVGGGGELTRLLRRPDVARTLDGLSSPLQTGFYTQRALEQVGFSKATSALALLRKTLEGALGERGARLADALVRELERARAEVRSHVRDELARRTLGTTADSKRRRLEHTAFTSLTDAEVDEVRGAVRRLAEKLRGKARVRRKHARRGALDLRRTIRLGWRTAGVPLVAARKHKKRDRPRLIVLCDVSDSVRLAARFMLELVWALQELFSGTRSFVFVSELGEVTALLRREPVGAALGRIFAGEAVSLASNSNYGAVLAAFWKKHLASIDRRSTVVVIGDGRNNYQADEAWALADLKRRARAVLWINPERRGGWAIGDSAMLRYAPHCTRVLEVSCAAELEDAARALIAM